MIPKVKRFLGTLGLDLNKAKTGIVNVSEWFDFLGFRFQRFHRKDASKRTFLYQPSRNRMDRFARKLKGFLRHNRHVEVKELIKGLNQRIRGFCNYFKWRIPMKRLRTYRYGCMRCPISGFAIGIASEERNGSITGTGMPGYEPGAVKVARPVLRNTGVDTR
ncbi:hypothetical protein GF325_04430 [Candidatus Bathyarchaeota archaeon]|nr:hypothetical protein [Candidatus Bathyarchaeota archaeon]